MLCYMACMCVGIFWRLFARFVLVLLILMFLCVLESYYVIILVKWLVAIVAPSIGFERGRGVLVFMV